MQNKLHPKMLAAKVELDDLTLKMQKVQEQMDNYLNVMDKSLEKDELPMRFFNKALVGNLVGSFSQLNKVLFDHFEQMNAALSSKDAKNE